MKISNRKIVVVNQAVNYLTIGICNEFAQKFEDVALITGSVHVQGEELDTSIKIKYINKWKEEHGFKKVLNYLMALCKMYFLLLTKYRKYEVFFISVPPMGYLLNLFVPHRFSMIIWDVYPDVFKIAGMKESHLVYKTWKYLNRKSFKKAYRLFTISDKMADLLACYVQRDKIMVQPIWAIFQENKKVDQRENPFIQKHKLEGKFVVQYSGNIGLTHNVEALLDIAKQMVAFPEIIFQIIGRGARKKILENRVNEENISNCVFLPFQSDKMFPYSLSAADLGVVILDEKVSKGSVPSKSYNLMSYGIPALYIASEDSELKNYTHKYNHAQCFTKDQFNEVQEYILELSRNKVYYEELSRNNIKASEDFKRENATKFVNFYLEV